MATPASNNHEPLVKYNRLELAYTNKLLIYDTIAGKHYPEYDDFVIMFVKNVMDVFRYIQLSYPYPFTGAHNFSWQEQINFDTLLKPKFSPLQPTTYYNYLEIYKTFFQPTNHPSSKTKRRTKPISSTIQQQHPATLFIAGADISMLEVLSQMKSGPISSKYIHMPTDTEPAKFNDMKTRIVDRYPGAEVTLLGKNVYTILESGVEPADLFIYNNMQRVLGVQMAFSHTNIINMLVGIICGLKYTKPGGAFIIHFNSIINKYYANLYLFCKQWFQTSHLYLPECVNEYKQTGTHGIFLGFKGIPAEIMATLDNMIFTLRKVYKNGDQDSNIYDPELRKLCTIYKFFIETEKLPYINLELYIGAKPVHLKDDIYKEVRDFNNNVYARKLAFCKKVFNYWKKVQYPALTITYEQYHASIAYLKRWAIPYTFSKLDSRESRVSIMDTGHGLYKLDDVVKQKAMGNILDKGVYTYKVVSAFMDMAMVEAEFKARGNWIPYEPGKGHTLDFFFSDSYNVNEFKFWGYESGLKNLVGDSKKMITNKLNLYNNLKDIPGTDRFLPKTITFDILGKSLGYLDRFRNLFKPNRPYICKIVDMGAGQGIICTDKFHEFREFMRKYINIINKNPKANYRQWVLQEYITNPWLLKGKKFHIRQLFFYQPGSRPSYYMYHSRIALAEAPYVKGNWLNKEIHDTHFHKYHGEDWPFVMNFSQAQWSQLKDQFEFIYACLVSVLKGECYSESKNCFELFGVDLMITDKMEVKLIEVNDKIGMSGTPEYNRKVFQGVMTRIVDKYYTPKYAQLAPGEFIQAKWLNLDARGKFYKTGDKYVNTYAEFKSKKRVASSASFSKSKSRVKQKQYTYLVRTDYFKDEYIDNCFKSRGNWLKVTDNNLLEYKHKPIDFIYIDGLNYVNTKYYGLQAMLKNTVGDAKQIISQKQNLNAILAEKPYTAKFIMPALEVDLQAYLTGTNNYAGKISGFFKPGKIYIFKPVTGMAGQGIRVFSNFMELDQYMLDVVKANKHKWSASKLETVGMALPAKEPMRIWVLQEYIDKPLLFTENGQHYKFHIRHFYLYQPGNRPSYYKNAGKIALAKKPYVAGNWDDPDIHDTHFHGNANYSWPESTNLTPAQLELIDVQIAEFYKQLDKLIHAGCYKESRACYELFGVDFMITQDYELKVLEINAGLGLGSNNTSDTKADLFNGMLELVVDKYFRPLNTDLIQSVHDKFTEIS